MKRRKIAEVLFAYSGEPHRQGIVELPPLAEYEAAALKPWMQLIEQLNAGMSPVQPSPTFVRNLGRELRKRAGQQIAQRERLQRTLLIGAAVGSIVSVASIAGAIAFVLLRRRDRAQAIQGTVV